MRKHASLVLKELSFALLNIDDAKTQQFVRALSKAGRIYITGVGRSGLMVKAFGQRLMHLGFEVHLADEITAPAIAKRDILVACSGTGATHLTVYMAQKAARIGAHVIALTARKPSALSRCAKITIVLPTPLEHAEKQYGISSRQPARALFEQVLLLYLDSVILHLIEALKIRPQRIEKRHANLE